MSVQAQASRHSYTAAMQGAKQPINAPQEHASVPTRGAEQPANIVLTGFMGTGKSTVGRMLAHRLSLKHVDTDQLIERRHGPIPRIFSELGEDEFRTIERNIAVELSADVGYVISTGGRFMLDPHNAELLGRNNRVFALVADIEVIMNRVMRRRASRPLLAGDNPREAVIQLLEQRRAGYAEFEQVATDDRPPTRVVEQIVQRLALADS